MGKGKGKTGILTRIQVSIASMQKMDNESKPNRPVFRRELKVRQNLNEMSKWSVTTQIDVDGQSDGWLDEWIDRSCTHIRRQAWQQTTDNANADKAAADAITIKFFFGGGYLLE